MKGYVIGLSIIPDTFGVPTDVKSRSGRVEIIMQVENVGEAQEFQDALASLSEVEVKVE